MDLAVGEMDDAIGHAGHDGVVRDDDGERAEFAVRALDGFEHDDAGLHVERASRFVAEQDFRAFGDGAGDGDALLLTAGELRGKMVQTRREPHHVQRLFGRHRVAGDLRDERDVLARREAGDEIVELENEPDAVSAVARELSLVRVGEIDVAIPELAGSRHVEAAKLIEQGGFSTAGWSEQHDEFAGVEIQVHSGQCADFSGA